MPTNCLIPKQAEKLKKAFREGKITFSMLYNLGSSQARIDFLSKYVGTSAKLLNTKLEKVFLSPNQKLAARNWIYQNLGEGKPLYKELTMEDAKKIRDNLSIRSLSSMKSENRIKALSEYVSQDVAESLNVRFLKLKKSGNLANWEARTMGTDLLKQDKKMKGEIAKLEALDDLGVLNPKQLEQFMESFVESKLGINLSVDEAKELSKLVKQQKDSFDKLMETNDWTYTNEENLTEYLVNVRKLEDFENNLMPITKAGTFNKLVDYARASILASPRILRNSFLYQIIPGTERAITKRLVSGNFSDGDLKSNIFEKLQSKLSGIKPSKESGKFIKNQTAMATRIYHKTGYDISRMQTLNDGYTFFGEKVGKFTGKGILSKFGRAVNLAPKWMAGGTDMLFANIGRADTSIMMSKEIASLEAKRGKLKGITKQERAEELLKDSYSFTPKDPQAKKIRELGILDAHMMNNTQPDGMADKVIEYRNMLGIGKYKVGRAIIPFAKIATTAISDGLQTASGYGIVKGIKQIRRATKLNGIDRSTEMQKGVSGLLRYLGFAGAVMLLASLLDDDDYIAPYDLLSYKEYQMARAKGASSGMVRLFGKWIPLRYLPIINIPLAAVMTARQNKSKGGDTATGYIIGMLGMILETPGIKETRDFLGKKVDKLLSAKDKGTVLKSMGLTGDDVFTWAKVRAIPSIISYDLYNKIVEQDSKYDFTGRNIEKGGIFKDDKTNEIILEFDNLGKEGEMPTISNPSGDYAVELQEKLGDDKYYKKLAELQKRYAEEVSKTMSKSWYKDSTFEEKKKEIDDLRKEFILDELKYLNKNTNY